jgi:hypothetical protein
VSIEGNTARYVDLSESGLLWLINTTVFHPRGYALAVNTEQPVRLLLLGDGKDPVTFADEMHEIVEQKFAAVEALLKPRNITPPTLTGDGAPPEVREGVEHHEGHLDLAGTGGAFVPSPQFASVEGEEIRFGVTVEDGEEPAEGTAEGRVDYPDDATDLPEEFGDGCLDEHSPGSNPDCDMRPEPPATIASQEDRGGES